MSYTYTFILVAEDCPVTSSVVPPTEPGKKSVASIHYELLAGHPYEHSQEEVLFQTYVQRKALSAEELATCRDVLWNELFAKDQPCLRTSPLAKRYGWGFHFNPEGKVALIPSESPEYEALSKQAAKVYKALRSSRA